MFKSKVSWLNSMKPEGDKQIAMLSILPKYDFSCMLNSSYPQVHEEGGYAPPSHFRRRNPKRID